MKSRQHSAARYEAQTPDRIVRIALIAAVVLHLLLAVALHDAMRPAAVDEEPGMLVRILDAPPVEPPLPEPEAAVRQASREPVAPRAEPALPRVSTLPVPVPQAEEPAPRDLSSLHIYKADGSIDLPKDIAAAPEPKPNFIGRSVEPSSLMTLKRPVKIRPNHFAGAWKAPQNENLLGATLRKTSEFIDENLSVEKEFTLPWGAKVKCKASFMFVMAAGGCGWGYGPKPYEPEQRWKPATVFDEK